MSIELIGMIRTNNRSEIHGPTHATAETEIDLPFLAGFARAHEAADFDRVLIGYHSTAPDGLAIAAYAAAHTQRLGFLIAHRPGFLAPTVAARAAITLDHLTGGRIALHLISGGSDAEQRKDGDWVDKDARYRRTDEFLDIVTRVWSSETPFDHDGEFYRVAGAFSDVKPLQRPRIPIFFGGASPAAIPVGAKHADVYMLWGEPIAAVKERIADVRGVLPPGREIRFSVSLRLILGDTEDAAWAKAGDILDRIVASSDGQRVVPDHLRPQAAGSRRLLEFAAQREIHDERLWTPIAAATGAGGNTTCLVGTPEQVADAILAYVDAGVSAILVRGFEPLEDAVAYGRDVFPLVRAGVAARDALATTQPAPATS